MQLTMLSKAGPQHRRGKGGPLRKHFLALQPLLVVAALAIGCSRESPRAPDEAVRAYGYGPQPNGHVTYQPDVIMIGGGPKAIRGVSDDDLTWTIDANAEGASQLSVGKIMFATSRAVGRVLAIEPRGKDLAVTLGPVSLTEVIRDADLRLNMRVNPDETIFHESAHPATNAALGNRNSDVLRPAVWRPEESSPWLTPVGLTRKMTGKLKVGSWEIEPFFKQKGTPGMTDEAIRGLGDLTGKVPQPEQTGDEPRPSKTNSEDKSGELGLKIIYNAYAGGQKAEGWNGVTQKTSNGLKFGTSLRFYGENIRVRSHVSIAGGKVSGPSTIVLDGIDRVRVGLLGGVDNGLSDNIKARVEVPAELVEQIPPELTEGVPLAIHIKFKFIVETAFGGAKSTLWTHGTYKLTGPIGYENGKLVSPTLETEEPMMNDLHGITIGVSAVVTAVETRLLVGLGTEAFMMGPYFKVIIAAGVTKGSILAFGLGGLKGGPTCHSVTIKGDIGYGMGVIVDTNKYGILGTLTGGAVKKAEFEVMESSATFFNQGWFAPDIPLCRP